MLGGPITTVSPYHVSLRRSTQNLLAIHKPPSDYPIFWDESGHKTVVNCVRFDTINSVFL
jgi:hypothetical protein